MQAVHLKPIPKQAYPRHFYSEAELTARGFTLPRPLDCLLSYLCGSVTGLNLPEDLDAMASIQLNLVGRHFSFLNVEEPVSVRHHTSMKG